MNSRSNNYNDTQNNDVILAQYNIAPISFLAYYLWGIFCIIGILSPSLVVIIDYGLLAVFNEQTFAVTMYSMFIYGIPAVILLMQPRIYGKTTQIEVTNSSIRIIFGKFGKFRHDLKHSEVGIVSSRKQSIGGNIFNFGNIYIKMKNGEIFKVPSMPQPESIVGDLNSVRLKRP